MKQRLTEADRERIGDVFETHRGFVEAIAVQQVGRDDAGDVVAQVGLRLCQSLNGLRDPQAVRTWIYRVTVSVAKTFQRDRGRLERTREQIAAFTPAPPVVVPDAVVQEGQRRDALTEALNRLKCRERRLICNTLASDVVFVPSGADRVALSRARSRLRNFLINDPRLREP
jgi:DNA-directed RNA polymerase specialized sigma24 family protein